MQRAVWDKSKDRYHPIDDKGEVVLCKRISAWATRREGYRNQSGYSGNLVIVDMEHADTDGKVCGDCKSRMGKPLCDNCKSILREPVEFMDTDELYCRNPRCDAD